MTFGGNTMPRRFGAGKTTTTAMVCAYCGGPKIPPKVRKHPANVHWQLDPYCKRSCAEADLGIPIRVGMKA